MPPVPVYDKPRRSTIVMEGASYRMAKQLADRFGQPFSQWASRQIELAMGVQACEDTLDRSTYIWVKRLAQDHGQPLSQFLGTILRHAVKQMHQQAKVKAKG